MSDEYENKSSYQAQSSETISGNGSGVSPDMDYVRPAENPEQDLYHAHSFIEKWVFCQDAKVIGVQYFLTAVFTGVVGLILSWMMRMLKLWQQNHQIRIVILIIILEFILINILFTVNIAIHN